jgi:hypothetical protein
LWVNSGIGRSPSSGEGIAVVSDVREAQAVAKYLRELLEDHIALERGLENSGRAMGPPTMCAMR